MHGQGRAPPGVSLPFSLAPLHSCRVSMVLIVILVWLTVWLLVLEAGQCIQKRNSFTVKLIYSVLEAGSLRSGHHQLSVWRGLLCFWCGTSSAWLCA